MSDLAAILTPFKDATRCNVAVWVESRSGTPECEAATYRVPPPERWPTPPDGAIAISTAEGAALIAAVPGPRRAWLVVGPSPVSKPGLETHLRVLLPVVAHVLKASLEVDHAAAELAERYEEINLPTLYHWRDSLGHTGRSGRSRAHHLSRGDLHDTVGARRATVLVHDAVIGELRAVAALGAKPAALPAIRVDDETSVTARVFRTMRSAVLEAGDKPSKADAAFRDGALLSVPIMWSTPRGSEALGVVNISRGASAGTHLPRAIRSSSRPSPRRSGRRFRMRGSCGPR